MALFIDIGALSEYQTDRALNTIYKAIHDHGDDDAIWNPHESVFIRRLIELFTERGLMRLDGFRDELAKWVEGERHRESERVPRPAGDALRWTEGEMALARLYLETLPPNEFVLDDWLMLVDYLCNRYLSPTQVRTEAEWLAVRSTLMGRVQASMETITEKQADKVIAALPSTVTEAETMFDWPRVERATLQYATARGAENVQKIADDARHRMRNVIIRHHEQDALRIEGAPGTSLQSDLHDQFATLNRDWRRVAVTEAGENANQGYIASLKPGTFVKRMEHYKNACPFCRKIDGMVLEVVEPNAPNKDGWKQVWVGKNNVGRSAAPRKRVGTDLIEREPHELYWPPAGLAHPNCRGRWLPTIQDRPGDSKEFGDWLRATLGKKRAPADES